MRDALIALGCSFVGAYLGALVERRRSELRDLEAKLRDAQVALQVVDRLATDDEHELLQLEAQQIQEYATRRFGIKH